MKWRVFAACFLCLAFFFGGVASAATNCPAQTAGQGRVLQGIPSIAKAFAPLQGVKWEDFAKTLAGICAVESTCNPNYPHYTKSGKYSQYQGLVQMNTAQVTKAENQLNTMYPQMKRMAEEGKIPKDVWKFVDEAITKGRAAGGDRRFHPEYGMILGAIKHIQLHKKIQEKYPSDSIRQAAAHMLGQFSGITERKIGAGQWGSPISGSITQVETEAWALGQNRVRGASTVANAVEVAGAQYQSKMARMMALMSQVSCGLTSVPTAVAPFQAPAYQAGPGPVLDLPYNGVSSLMETGYLPARAAPLMPIQQNALPPLNPSANQFGTVQTTPVLEQYKSQTPVSEQLLHKSSVSPIPPPKVPSAANIVVQPKEVSRGEKALISWSSVGMKSSPACRVTVISDGTEIVVGQVNEGSRDLLIDRASTPGVLVFKVRCNALSGLTVERTASLVVR